jgi:hypothetical protein
MTVGCVVGLICKTLEEASMFGVERPAPSIASSHRWRVKDGFGGGLLAWMGQIETSFYPY